MISQSVLTFSRRMVGMQFCRKLSVSSTRMSETVGFIGLGNMGSHMAKNLLTKKYKVVAFDVVPDALKSLTTAGAVAAKSPADLASQVKIIVTMLPSNPHVREVYTGDNGILSGVQQGSLLLDSSTIDPAVSREVDKLATAKGAVYMDSPVSGGVVAARDALLTFMVGGSSEHFPKAKEILSNMGKNIVHCGAVGNGQAVKICNNMLLAGSMIATAEAMQLGIKLGLDPKLLAGIINTSSGRCWSSELYNPCPGVVDGIPSSNNYQGGFPSMLMLKDLGLAQSAAMATGITTPIGSTAHQIYQIMCKNGYERKDFAAVFQFLGESQNK